MGSKLNSIFILSCLSLFAPANAEMSERTFPATDEYIKSIESQDSLAKKEKAKASEEDTLRYKYYFYEAIRKKNNNDYNAAVDYFKKCIEIDSTKAQPYAELANYYFYLATSGQRNKEESALWAVTGIAAMDKAVKLDPTNDNNLETYIDYCTKGRDYPNAVAAIKKLLKQRPDKFYYYALLASIYTELNQPEEALKVWSELEDVFGYSNQITYSKFAIWVNQLKDKKKGLAEYDKPIKKYPRNVSFAINKSQAYQTLGMYNEDEKFLMKCLKNYPQSKSVINEELASLYVRAKSPKKLETVIDAVIEDKNIDFQSKSDVIEKVLNDKACQEVLTEPRLKKFVELYPDEPLSYIAYVTFLSNNDRENEAYKVLEKLVKVCPEQEPSWTVLIEHYADIKDLDALSRTIDEAVKAMPNSFEFRYRKGRWHLMQKENDEAIKNMKIAVDLARDKDMFKSAMIACEIGDIYSFEKDNENSRFWYEKSLEIDPNCVLTLNNYAYMLCEEGKELERAERMSAKTIQAEPTNPVYLDTYAWIYYRQGNYLSAQLYIEQAIKQVESYADKGLSDLYEHYGYILYKLGETELAKLQWQRAFKASDNPSDELRKIVEQGVLPK